MRAGEPLEESAGDPRDFFCSGWPSPRRPRSLHEEPIPAVSAPANPYRESPLPTCKCGTNRTHRAATPERQYTFMGTLYALWGGTSVPSVVSSVRPSRRRLRRLLGYGDPASFHHLTA